MAIDKYLDKIEDVLDDAVSIPLAGSRKLTDVDKLRDLLDAVRLSIPQEIKDAKQLVSERNTIIEEANAQAEEIIKRAEARAMQLVSQQEITKQAKTAASEMVSEAQNRTKEMERMTMEFTENALKKGEDALLMVFNEVKNARLALRGKVAAQSGKKPEQQDKSE